MYDADLRVALSVTLLHVEGAPCWSVAPVAESAVRVQTNLFGDGYVKYTKKENNNNNKTIVKRKKNNKMHYTQHNGSIPQESFYFFIFFCCSLLYMLTCAQNDDDSSHTFTRLFGNANQQLRRVFLLEL